MLEHQPELMNIEVTDVELRQVLHEIGEMEFGGSDAVRVADIVEATQCDPMAVVAILTRLRGKDILIEHSKKLDDHDSRISLLERWKSKFETGQLGTRENIRPIAPPRQTSAPVSFRSIGADGESEVFDFSTGRWHKHSQENEVDEKAKRESAYMRWSIEYLAVALLIAVFVLVFIQMRSR